MSCLREKGRHLLPDGEASMTAPIYPMRLHSILRLSRKRLLPARPGGARSIIVDRRFIAVALVIGLVSGLTSYFLFACPNSEVAGTTVSTPVSPVPAPQEESQVSRDNTPDPGSTGAEPAAIEPELVSLLPASGATAVEARREIPAPLNVRAQKTPQPQPKIEPASLSVSTPPAQTPAKSAPQKASVPPILAAPPPPPIAATVPTPEKPAPAPVEQATVPEPPVRSIAALPRPATKPDAIKADVTATKDKPAVQVPAPTPAPSKTAAISPPKEKKTDRRAGRWKKGRLFNSIGIGEKQNGSRPGRRATAEAIFRGLGHV